MIRLSYLMAEKSRNGYSPAKGCKSRKRCSVTMLYAILFLAALSGLAAAGQNAPGKALVMEKSKGNCLACHVISDGVQPGNIGPPLVGMKMRFPEVELLYEQIWDATVRNPDSRMPPFGRHGILSSEEIDLIVEYLYTL